MRVLVTGGAGYIGSIVAERLVAEGVDVRVYDDLSTGHHAAVPPGATLVQAGLADRAALDRALDGVDAVVHMAAVSLVGVSVRDPATYYHQNVVLGLGLLDAMRARGVHRLVFSSSAAVYGEPEEQPIDERAATRPTSPYGETKLALEGAIGWYARAYGLRAASLRYFNAAGASGRAGEDHDPETHLVPRVLAAVAGTGPAVQIFGDDYPTRDGTGVRDYIHVVDLADAHVRALRALDLHAAGGHLVLNLGCGGGGWSVREVIAAAEAVTGRRVPCAIGPRRPGDPAVLVAHSARAREVLGWAPRHESLEAILGSAWDWRLRHPRGWAG
ncbi:MAG: UDP-glucose 4-epimerase [Pseudomonadota bacterium]